MTPDMEALVAETIELTGAPEPRMLADDAPVLAAQAAAADDDDGFYLIGLIGGKDVGKSSFVNAIVGEQITQQTSHGPGTEIVIAYAHRSVAEELRKLLEREVPERFRIHEHQIDHLRRQVLLDLPDIDSVYADHVEITRRMLRHMLFPIWIQSVEKYADVQPQRLLARVAEGNDPANFIFALNKVDQLVAREGNTAPTELRDDYAQRIAKLLKLDRAPRVYMVSAARSAEFEFPGLQRLLAQQKSGEIVRQSRQLAGRQRDRTILAWLDEQQLPARRERAVRLLEDAQERTAARIGVPLLETALPRLVDDPAQRMAMIEPVVNARMARWPIVNVINSVLGPLMLLVRKNLGATSAAASGEATIDAYLLREGQTLAGLVQTTFAQLQQSSPAVATLYRDHKLWEDMDADLAAHDLRRRLSGTLERQRGALLSRLGGGRNPIAALVRWLLTIGAVLWFPLIQPLLEEIANNGFLWAPLAPAKVLIRIFGATYLLHSAGFLLIYFLVLWAFLRWDTQRRVNRMVERWKHAAARNLDPSTSLTGQVLDWLDTLLAPIRQHVSRLESLVARVDAFRTQLRATSREAA
jgi:hypothetical protein